MAAGLTENNWKEIVSRVELKFYHAINSKSLGSSSFPLSEHCSLNQSPVGKSSFKFVLCLLCFTLKDFMNLYGACCVVL